MFTPLPHQVSANEGQTKPSEICGALRLEEAAREGNRRRPMAQGGSLVQCGQPEQAKSGLAENAGDLERVPPDEEARPVYELQDTRPVLVQQAPQALHGGHCLQ